MNTTPTPAATEQTMSEVLRNVTTQEVRASVRAKGLTFIPNHDCSICGVPVGYVIDGERIFYRSSCDCGGWSPDHPSTWEDAAESVNMQTNREAKISVAKSFGIDLTRDAVTSIPPDGHSDYAALLAKLAAAEASLKEANYWRHNYADAVKAAEKECAEQARLNGMGSEREARLMARVERAEKLLEREADTARRMAAGAVESCPQEMREWFQRKAERLSAFLASQSGGGE